MAEPLKMVYEKDAPLDALKGKTVADHRLWLAGPRPWR